MARTRRQRGGQVNEPDEEVTLNETNAANESGAVGTETTPKRSTSTTSTAAIGSTGSTSSTTSNMGSSTTMSNNAATSFNIPTGLAPNSITTANNNNNTRRQVRSKLLAFQRRLNSQPSGATGPVLYDKELLIDQLFILNNTIQPLRAIVREADTLMDMIRLGTAYTVVAKHHNTRNIVHKRIRNTVKEETKKRGRNKKMKLKNIEKLFD